MRHLASFPISPKRATRPAHLLFDFIIVITPNMEEQNTDTETCKTMDRVGFNLRWNRPEGLIFEAEEKEEESKF
jgi:hypothetical protein